jgi:hypothetical protein
LAEYREYEPVVSSHSLMRVKKHTYSVPSRLMPVANSNGCKTGGLKGDLLPVHFLRKIR